MPDFYAEGEYDLSGFAVGIVKKDSVIDGKNIKVGDVLIGLPSSGVHSNGFSLVRRFVYLERNYVLSFKNNLISAFSFDLHAFLSFRRMMIICYLCRVLKQSGLSLKDQLPGESITLGEALIAPTVIYVKQVSPLVFFSSTSINKISIFNIGYAVMCFTDLENAGS